MELAFLEKTEYILDAWERHVAENPSAKALTDERHPRGFTRQQIDEVSGMVYGWLKAHQVGREDFVLLCLPRGAIAIVCMLGVWKAGAAFTLVEDNYPPERIAFIRKDCNCKVVIDLDVWQEILKTEALSGHEQTSDRDAAFAVYTSGTTGNPKGALHEYGSIKLIQAASIDRVAGEPRIRESDRMALVTPLNFVATIRRCIYAIYDGCHVFVVSYGITKNPVLIRQYYEDNRITITYCSPSMVRLVGDPGPTVRQMQIGGEPANGIFVEGKELVNGYSMSECGFPLAEFIIDKPYDTCPVGKPNIDQIHVRILDEDGNEVPDGTEGEICVENPFFRGYINLPEQTEQALRGGVYHTADIGKKLPDGNLVLMGRSTDMIKINGNRIEPAEIEAVGKKVLGVEWCAARGFVEQAHSFVALYYTADIEFDEMEVRHQMEQYLPYYMIPAYFVKVDEAPLLPNGKLNRKALPKPEQDAGMADYAAPRTETERILCEAFAVALELPQVGIYDNFYHLGGDSLGTMTVLAAADLPGLDVMDIFEGCTPERTAAIYEERVADSSQEDIAAIEEQEREKPHPLTPNQIAMYDYDLFSARSVIWNLTRMYRFPADTDVVRLRDAVNRAIANRPALYTVFEFDDECALVQRIAPEKMPQLSIEKMSEAEFDLRKSDLMRPFKMIGEPMIHAALYQTEEAAYLFFEVHHIVGDGSSWQLLNADIAHAWNGEPLPLDTYYAYLRQQEKLRKSEKYREDKKFFEETYAGDDWCINLIPDVKTRPSGRTFLPLSRMVSLDEMKAYEKNNRVSRQLLFTALGLLGNFAIEGKNRILVDWVFHDRTDDIRRNAFGCLFRYITVGVEIAEEMTLREFFDLVSRRSSEGLAHSSYEWSVKRDNVFDHDMMFVVYETADIMSGDSIGSIGGTRMDVECHALLNCRGMIIQLLENPEGILSLLFFNEAIYSKEKVQRAADVYSRLLDSILEAGDPGELRIAQLVDIATA